jgi:hypothetical protein
MICKNIFRSKKRSLFVLAGITVTYALILFTNSMPDIMNQMMNEHFREFQKMDYNIGFRYPVRMSAARDMTHLIHADYIEGRLEYPFELSNGNKKQPVSIVGLDRDTKFYNFHNVNGEKTEVPRQGILLSENLAGALDAKQGDLVRVKSYIPGRDDVYVQSIAWAVVEYIHNHPRLRARTLFATHYHELTQLADILPGVRNYNVAVTEADNQVVFLHKIVPGGADRSYGIHVAQLAGLPRPVIQRAGEILHELEASSGKAVRLEAGSAQQMALFPETNPLLNELKDLDLNALSPIEALNRLYEWQRRFLDRS